MIVQPGLRRKINSQSALLKRAQMIFTSNSYNGALYIAGDKASLFQDSAGTIPVSVVTDPVGLQSDKSGNINHSLQATAAARPTWQVDAGGRYYLSVLGTDDCYTCATGGAGTLGFFWCGVIQTTGGAGTQRMLFSDVGVTLGYSVFISTTNKLSIGVGNGAAWTILASTATVDVGTKYLLSAWDDGTNLNVQINNATIESVARPVVAAGTASFTRFKDNGAASSFFIGYEYASVYVKNSGLATASREDMKKLARSYGGL